MGARTVLLELATLVIAACTIMLLMIVQASPAFATGPVHITTTVPSNVVPYTSYNLVIYFNDTSGALINKPVTVSVTSPDGTATVNSSASTTVTTNSTGYATIALRASKKAGIDNVTAVYNSLTSNNISIAVGSGSPSSISVTASQAFRPANGISTAVINAVVTDAYGNPVNNVIVNFTTSDGTGAGSSTTGTDGTARWTAGPYSSPRVANITASAGAATGNVSVGFLNVNNLFLLRYPDSTLQVNTGAEVDAVFYLDFGGNTFAAGVPLTFTAYGPDYSTLSSSTIYTDANGTAKFFFTMSPIVGTNTIVVSNDGLGGTLQTTVITGTGGDVSNIILTPYPQSPIPADGTSTYTLNIRALDSGGNPVRNKQLSIVKNNDTNYTKYATTNINGYVAVSIPSSKYVCNDVYTVTAANVDVANNTTSVSNSTTLSYIAGPPAIVNVIADPDTVANANVSTPVGASSNVHSTSIIATVTDLWGHPLPGQSVSITSLNTTQGNIIGASNGMTEDGGNFIANFTLNSSNNGTNVTGGAPVRATSGPLSAICYVKYTDSAFLSINTSVTPKSNITVNSKIHVNITMTGIGWKVKGQGYDIALVFDTSGSMDWLANTIYPPVVTLPNGSISETPLQGYIKSFRDTGYNDSYYWEMGPSGYTQYDDVITNYWTPIYNYTYTGDGTSPIQIMFSSSYSNYSSDTSGTCYYLKVTDPTTGYNISTYVTDQYDPSGTWPNAEHSVNENYVEFTSPVPGATYKIYGACINSSTKGPAPYNMMVLTTPKRLGQRNTDFDSAAKNASTIFVSNPKMAGNQISIVWFNDSGNTNNSRIARHLTLVNTTSMALINASIRVLKANGGTQISDGINSAITELNNLAYNNSSNKKVAILISDGYSQTPGDDIMAARAANASHITIYTIGIGMPDENNLRSIANITGGNYTLVMSDVQLQNVMGGISGNLNKLIGNVTSLNMMTSCTNVNGILLPDTTYMPGSTNITYPDGSVSHADPMIGPGNTTLNWNWNPGVPINLTESWSIEYDLNVMNPGLIMPITNNSYINLVVNGTSQVINFTAQPIFANNTSDNNFSINGKKLNLTITSPPNASHGSSIVNITSSSQLVKWAVNYTGNYSYKQTITINNANISLGTDYNEGPGLHEFSYQWNSGGNPGDYSFAITADEVLPTGNGDEASDWMVCRKLYHSGQIILA